MSRKTQRYSKEFKAEAVRTVLENQLSISEGASRLSLPEGTLGQWVTAARKGLGTPGSRTVAELESEILQLRKALNEARLERDILKKATASSPVEWLTDNGSCYRANETRQFARMLGLEPKNTAVRSPESNGIAESFVKTIKRDYISIMPKPDGLTAAKNLAEAFEHYNEWHPHSALGYRSPREYLRQRACNGLSDNRCLEI
ncbi:insertion element IS2 transposase InsD [Shigella sonnei]|nr:transposase [Shigella sonnei]SRU78794.1 insertion element IS2 transposase InsD [Shigella sonnei]